MPTRQARVVASLLACIAGLVAVDDVTMTYSYDEVAAGRDIKEGIYASHGSGEFDEWRLRFGLAPGIDRVRLKSTVNGLPHPGPSAVENDGVVNSPAMAPLIGVAWVLGDYDRGDEGWFATLGVEYTRRRYTIRYGLGVASVPLKLSAATISVGMGYGCYLSSRLRYEVEPFINAGMMWSELDLVDLSIPAPEVRVSGGPVIEGGLRNALIWHPARTQAWHLGAALDYRYGYAQTAYRDSGTYGDINSEAQFWWYGFSYSVFYGMKF